MNDILKTGLETNDSISNPNVNDLKQLDSNIDGYTVWGDKTITHDSDVLNQVMTTKLVSNITSNLKHIIKPYKVVLCHYSTMINDDIKNWFDDKGIDNIDDNIDRHNPLLVECIEWLKEDNPQYYKDSYEIVELKGSQYFIQCDSRCEWVLEPDDIDWIDIEKDNHVE